MRIAEIEARIKNGDCSEEMINLFKSALKRVPRSGRCQHCYTTAALMPPHYHHEAISLIQYGLIEQCTGWFDRMRSHYNLAVILETNEDYLGAKKAYGNALSAVDIDKRDSYASEFAAHMMRTELHISSFEYTDDLESYYNTAILADEFNQAFQKKKFYHLLAEIVIFLKHCDFERAKGAFEEAHDMLRPGFEGPLHWC